MIANYSHALLCMWQWILQHVVMFLTERCLHSCAVCTWTAGSDSQAYFRFARKDIQRMFGVEWVLFFTG